MTTPTEAERAKALILAQTTRQWHGSNQVPTEEIAKALASARVEALEEAATLLDKIRAVGRGNVPGVLLVAAEQIRELKEKR